MTDALAITDLGFAYSPTGPRVLRVPSLRLAPGERVLLRGPSGCGKSTLLHLIAGLIEPSSGEVRVAGRAIHALRGPARDRFRGRAIGMIFQTFNLLPGMTALENVMLAMHLSGAVPPAEQRARAAQLLDRLGLTSTHAMAHALSIGQQQRVAVARALACGPALVLADEPTASLDPANARAAIELIQSACHRSGAALLCVSHDPTLGDGFDRVLDFDRLSTAGAAASAARALHGEGA